MNDFVQRQPRMQTPHKENSDPATFKVGTWEMGRPTQNDPCGRWFRMGLPNPRWPEPGKPATKYEAAAYDAECDLRLEAEILLDQYLWYVRSKTTKPGSMDEHNDQMAGHRISWLTGVWNAKGIRCPDWNEFVAMSIETPPEIEPLTEIADDGVFDFEIADGPRPNEPLGVEAAHAEGCPIISDREALLQKQLERLRHG